MPEDGELISQKFFADEHPANFDQQVSVARDLLPKAKAFVLCIMVPDEEWTEDHQSVYSHTMIGNTPGVSMAPFLTAALQDILETASNIGEVGDDGGSTAEG